MQAKKHIKEKQKKMSIQSVLPLHRLSLKLHMQGKQGENG